MVPVKPPILSAHDSGIALLGCQPLDPERIFEPLGLADADSLSLSVAVPPKLPSLFPHDLPLAGKRFAVKEVFSIRGLRMALANRAHYAISQPAEATATVVEKLLNAGAELTGVVKCSCMASREDPAEAVDFISPFNPRGDGYQSPTDSSNGSAAAIASYEWLDFTLGTDSKTSLKSSYLSKIDFLSKPLEAAVDPLSSTVVFSFVFHTGLSLRMVFVRLSSRS